MTLAAYLGQLAVDLVLIVIGLAIVRRKRFAIASLARLWKARLHLRWVKRRYLADRQREEDKRTLTTVHERRYVEGVVSEFVKRENAKRINAILDGVFAEEDAAKRQREAEGAELDMSA